MKDVLGIAGILPLDHTIVLDHRQSVTGACQELRERLESLSSPPIQLPPLNLNYISNHRSGGGRIGNIIAYLGKSGHDVAICGAVGDDRVGELVKEDLRNCNVSLDNVATYQAKSTRVVFVIATTDGRRERQIHYKPPNLARFGQKLLKEKLPPSRILVISQINKSVERYASMVKSNSKTVVSFHLTSVPWRRIQKDIFKQLIQFVDIWVISKDMADSGLLPDLKTRGSNELIVIYGGVDQLVEAIYGRGDQVIKLPGSPNHIVMDPTGVMECFHGAFLSCLLRVPRLFENAESVEAALKCANEIAARHSTRVGSRSFPIEDQGIIMENFLKETSRQVFISYVHENSQEVQQLCDKLIKHGVNVWLDRNNIMPGTRWQWAIQRAIHDEAFFIACFSREYNGRDETYMNEELTLAIERLRRLPHDRAWFIPVKLSECEIPDRSIGAGETLQDLQYVELYKNWDDGIKRILLAIGL